MMGGVGIEMGDDLGPGFFRDFRGVIGAIVRDDVDIEFVLGVILVIKEVFDRILDNVFFVSRADDDRDPSIILAILEMLLGEEEEKDHDELEKESDRGYADRDVIDDF